MGGPWNRRNWAGSWRCPRLAVFIIDTSEEPPDLPSTGDWTTSNNRARMRPYAGVGGASGTSRHS